jgi:hypothetical protein
MKVTVAHDIEGNITGIIGGRAESGRQSGVVTPAGHGVAEVEFEDVEENLTDPKGVERLLSLCAKYRVEPLRPAKLVLKRPQPKS